jgi:hypothetical protein
MLGNSSIQTPFNRMVSLRPLSFSWGKGLSIRRSIGQYIQALPYGRNMHPIDLLIVLTEKRGTCSTKHALLRRLAIEQNWDFALVLEIYEMTEQNHEKWTSYFSQAGARGS